jgi:integrase
MVMATVYRRERSPYWQARICVGGAPNRISTGETDRRKAQKAADEAEAEANRNLIQRDELRLVTATTRFFELKRLRPKTVRGYKSNLTNIVSKLGDFPLRLLTHDRLKHYVEIRLQEVGSVAIRRDLAFLSSVYTTLGLENPLLTFNKRNLPEARERTRWLTPAEVDRMIAACREPHQKTFIILLVETGMRMGELLQLRWQDVDIPNRQIVLPGDQTKNGTYRIIPLTERALGTLIDTQKQCATGHVLTNPETGKAFTTFRGCWAGICKRASVSDATIHTLRHTFASWGLQRGIGELALQDWMGHKTRSMTKRYAKSSYDSLQEAARRFSQSTLFDTQPSVSSD